MSYEIAFYRRGENRVEANDKPGKTHTYAETTGGDLIPMCDYGWNRSDGERFSIWRDAPGTEGDCKICRKNVAEGKPPVEYARPHKTRYL